MELGLRPSSRGAGADVAEGAGCERTFGYIIAAWRLGDDEQIVLAGGEINLLDLDSYFLRKLLGGLASLGSILDSADSLICPVQRQNERGHVILH
jgi:hypothetical protein